MRKHIIGFIMTVLIVISACNIPLTSNAVSGEWIQADDGRWWYSFSDGSYAASEYIAGYWLNSDGWYDSSWNGSWVSNPSGWWFESGSWYPKSEWLEIDGFWYYFNEDGYMASDEWIDNCYVNSEGVWIPDYKEEKTTNNEESKNDKADSGNITQKADETVPDNKSSKAEATVPENKTPKAGETIPDKADTKKDNKDAQDDSSEDIIEYTVFDPKFNSVFEAIPKAGWLQEDGSSSTSKPSMIEDASEGWICHNYIVCNYCHNKYESYEEFRKNDTCCIHTFKSTDTTYYKIGFMNEWKPCSVYDSYFKYSEGSIEYIQKKYQMCECGEIFETADECWYHQKSYADLDGFHGHNGSQPEVRTISTVRHYPELISEVKQQ